jgi:uncharacterized repeat protein (TIGR01451 family)
VKYYRTICCALIFLIIYTNSHAETPAFTVIENQATATYFDPSMGIGSVILSNIAKIQVAAVYGLGLSNDRSINASSGNYINFSHVLTNQGNVTDTYILNLIYPDSYSFDFLYPQIFIDHNSNGRKDPGEEPVQNKTVILEAGETIYLVIAATVPGTVLQDMVGQISIEARSKTKPDLFEKNTDTAHIDLGVLIQMTKSNQPICIEQVEPGDKITYRIDMVNTGYKLPNDRPIPVMTQAGMKQIQGILLEDTIPGNTTFNSLKDIHFSPVYAMPVLMLSNNLDVFWIDTDSWNQTDLVAKIGLIIPLENFGRDTSAHLSFSVKVVDEATTGTMIYNKAGIDLNGSGSPDFETNETCNKVFGDPPSIKFVDSHYTPTQTYQLKNSPKYIPSRDNVYLELVSGSFNINPTIADEVLVTVQSASTRDTIQIWVYETKPNSCVFRSRTPLILIENESQTRKRSQQICQEGGVCYLRSTKIDILTCEAVDPVEGPIKDVASVEPFGYVFDAITLTPLEGAIVSLHHVDNSIVVDVYGNEILPEMSNASGRYQFSNVKPDEGYYITVDPPSNYQFPSSKPARMMAFKYVISDSSYGRNGFDLTSDSGVFSLGMRPDALELDIPLDPINVDGSISLNKTVEETILFYGQTVSYSLTIFNQTGKVLTDTQVFDILPDGFTYVADSLQRKDNKIIGIPLFETDMDIPGFTKSPNFIITIGHLGIDEVLVLTYKILISPQVPEGEHTNTAIVRGKLSGSTSLFSNQATATVQIGSAMRINKSVTDAMVNIGQTVTYYIQVKNVSAVTLDNTRVWDWLPEGFEYVKGSTQIDQVNAADPTLQMNNNTDIQEMIFHIGNFIKMTAIEISYDLKPTVRALSSNRSNTARAIAVLPNQQIITSNIAEAVVNLTSGPLVLEKNTSIETAYIGDWVPYKIRINNSTGLDLTDIVVYDQLPYGFTYEKGSARLIDDQRLLRVKISSGNLRLFLPDLKKNEEISLTYLLLITPGALDSDGINAAYVTGVNHDLTKKSNNSRTKVDIEQENLFSDRGIIFGKIFVDADNNRIQTKGEWPVGGVKLFLEDGTWVITDENGQFSLYGIPPGLHVLKLDPLSLPSNVQLLVTDIEQAGDSGSRFVDMTLGEFYRADFLLGCPCEHRQAVWDEIKARNNSIRGEWMLEKAMDFDNNRIYSQKQPPSDSMGDISSGLVFPDSMDKQWQKTAEADGQTISSVEKSDLSAKEKMEQYASQVTKDMARTGIFLWPKSNISRDGKFVAVVRMGITPELKVNGEKISDDHLGEKAFNQKENAQILAWYGVQLKPGKNLVSLETMDAFGNLRKLITKEFYVPGAPAHLKIVIPSNTLSADGGRSMLPVEIRLEDQNYKLASGIHFVTLNISQGQFLEPDIQLKEPGHQTRVENGHVILHLRSSERTGTVKLHAHLGQDLSQSIDIHMVTPKRPMIAVGLVNISMHINQLSDRNISPPNQLDDFDDELFFDNRVAVFLKGKIRGDILLTLSYDSSKNDETTLFRDIDPNAYYPIYGDASIKGFDAQSHSCLYVKLEKGEHQIMWGDYVTDSKQNDHIRLGRFHRTFTGASARYKTKMNDLTVFGARPYHDHFVEEISANGTATFYQIQKDRLPILENSETVEIITTDIDNSGMIIKTRQLKRFSEYTIDAFSGYITFHEAIPSRDIDGNRNYIRIGYSSETQTKDYNVAGLRLSQQLSKNLTWGGAYAMDDRDDEGTQLASGFVAVKPFENHEIITELATQNHEDGSLDGQASRIDYIGRWRHNIETTLSFAQADKGFTNPDAIIANGRQEMKGEITYKPRTDTEIKTTLIESKGLDTNDERRSASLDISKRFGSIQASAGYRHTEQKNIADNDTVDSLRLKLENSFNLFDRPGKLYGEIEQDVSESERQSLKAGGEYYVHKKTKIYAEHELINSLDGISGLSTQVERSHTKFGVNSQIVGSTETYAEHRIRGGMDSREMESVTGLRNSFDLVPKLSISPQLEYIHTYRGDEQGDAFSCSLGISDKRNKNCRTSIRMDTRLGKQVDYYGFKGSHATRLNENWSGLIREDYALEEPVNANNRIQHVLTIGGAYRPKKTNQYHFLSFLRWKEERHQNDIKKRRVWMFSSHHNYQLTADNILSGRYATKFQTMTFTPDEYESIVHLLGLKYSTRFNLRWGMNFRSGMLTSFGGSGRYSFGLGLDYLIRKNLRIAMGYQLTGFRDKDLDTQRYYGQGLRLGLQWKFDESLFQVLEFLQ